MVKVDEPDDDTACLMLRDSRPAMHSTTAYICWTAPFNRRAPVAPLSDRTPAAGQGGDLLDTAGARVRMSLDTLPEP